MMFVISCCSFWLCVFFSSERFFRAGAYRSRLILYFCFFSQFKNCAQFNMFSSFFFAFQNYKIHSPKNTTKDPNKMKTTPTKNCNKWIGLIKCLAIRCGYFFSLSLSFLFALIMSSIFRYNCIGVLVQTHAGNECVRERKKKPTAK